MAIMDKKVSIFEQSDIGHNFDTIDVIRKNVSDVYCEKNKQNFIHNCHIISTTVKQNMGQLKRKRAKFRFDIQFSQEAQWRRGIFR